MMKNLRPNKKTGLLILAGVVLTTVLIFTLKDGKGPQKDQLEITRVDSDSSSSPQENSSNSQPENSKDSVAKTSDDPTQPSSSHPSGADSDLKNSDSQTSAANEQQEGATTAQNQKPYTLPKLTEQQKKAKTVVQSYRKKLGGNNPFVSRKTRQKLGEFGSDQLPSELAKKVSKDPTELSAADLKKLKEEKKKLSQKPKAAKKVASCYTTSFKHKRFRSRIEAEACTEHKNLIKVSIPAKKSINSKSVCIRVNGTPVKYQRVKGKPEYFIIGPLASYKSKITATFCTGRASCREKCVIPKDDFLDAIGGLAEEIEDTGKYVTWDVSDTQKKGPSKTEKELDSLLKEFRTQLVGKKSSKVKYYTGWIKAKESASCIASQKPTRVSQN